MSKRNPEYDFKWCPGCGDFGVKRAMEMAIEDRVVKRQVPVEKMVVVAGIGCSGNMVHLVEGPQPFGIHGIHGRTLPIAMGIKMGNPELDVLIAAGDGDFLSIGAEHIGPAAQRNLNVTAIVMDNGVYGLTKGQSSPTTGLGVVTSTTPQGKVEAPVKPFELYLSLGVSFIASTYSSQVKEMARLISLAMDFPGFAIVHVQSPCTTYNDNYDLLRGNPKKGVTPTTYSLPADYDATSRDAAFQVARQPGIPLGVVYQAPASEPFERRLENANKKLRVRTAQELVNTFQF
ncbi:MAG: 2-oxoacid:ferredoxin oxidoreductase subunit beta [Chloroflexi bacterium]|nr:2-oxoacid:ferredoxin oxidoreductase subunit beta [Chloroflexota bacterium]